MIFVSDVGVIDWYFGGDLAQNDNNDFKHCCYCRGFVFRRLVIGSQP